MIETLAGEFVRVTEAAAIAAARHMGEGLKETADDAAVTAMREVLAQMPITGRVVIGEGERDEAPMLYIGEIVGTGDGIEVDLAVDPIEGTNLVAHGLDNAISVMAVSSRGGILHAPDIYMEKLIVGPTSAGTVDLEAPVEENLGAIATALRRDVRDLTVVMLNRPRHADLIEQVRHAGSRIKLIQDGDVAPAIAAAIAGTGIHAVMGIGGAPEGVLAAAALRCLGGEIQGRLWFRNDAERERAASMGLRDPDRVLRIDDMVSGEDVLFVASGITPGDLFRGVRFFGGGVRVHSLVMAARSGEIRFVDSIHIRDRAKVGAVRL